MTNKLKSAMYKVGVGASVLAWILLTSKDALAQNIASNQKNKADIENTENWQINSLALNNPLAFTLKNIYKYYPDKEIEEHANFLINRLWNWMIRDSINDLLSTYIIKNISDPKQQIWTIMYSLEDDVFWWDKEVKAVFSSKYEVENPINFKISRKFEKAFKLRITTNLNQMLKDIEQWKRILEENRIRIEKIMEFITTDMVKSDPKTKELIESWNQRYINLKQEPTNPHIISLFEALK
jgi:hypothetical protein